MKSLEVLGAGCARCKKLFELTDQVARELGIEYRIEKVEDIERIMNSGVLMTPALIVDGEVKVAGRVPGADELKKLLI